MKYKILIGAMILVILIVAAALVYLSLHLAPGL